jgi:peptidoglycan/LPS O-acetylase OafA/YrhL
MLLGHLYLFSPEGGRRFDAAFAVVLALTLGVLSLGVGGYPAAAATIGFAVLIYLAARSAGSLAALLGSPLMLLMGGASYSIYLLQGGVRDSLGTIFPASIAPLLHWPILMAVSIAVFIWIEEPARRSILRRFGRRTVRASG